MAKSKSYEDQLAELEQIIADIEDDAISIDELSDKVKRAAVLLKSCRSVLRNTEQNVKGVLKDLED